MVAPYDELAANLRHAAGEQPSDGVLEACQLLGDLDHLEQRIRTQLPRLWEPATFGLGSQSLLYLLRQEDTEFAKLFPATRTLTVRQAVGGVAGVPAAGETSPFTILTRDLRLDTETWYQKAHRLLDVTERLAQTQGVECKQVRIVRNQLIEHPDKDKHSGVTHPTFGWSAEHGPQIKGIRIGGQAGRFEDRGLFTNSEALRNSLSEAINRAREKTPTT